jgi:hypothetical protein
MHSDVFEQACLRARHRYIFNCQAETDCVWTPTRPCSSPCVVCHHWPRSCSHPSRHSDRCEA